MVSEATQGRDVNMLWTEQNEKILSLVLEHGKPPKEVASDLGISYHHVYVLLSRSRLRYFLYVSHPSLIEELLEAKDKHVYVDFKRRFSHLYHLIVRDFYVKDSSFIRREWHLVRKKENIPIRWRCPKCGKVNECIPPKLECKKC